MSAHRAPGLLTDGRARWGLRDDEADLPHHWGEQCEPGACTCTRGIWQAGREARREV